MAQKKPQQPQQQRKPMRGVALPLLAASVAVLGLHNILRSTPAADSTEANQVALRPMALQSSAPAAFLYSETNKDVRDVALACFPGAMRGAMVMKKLLLQLWKYEIKRSDTVYGTSISSDNINLDPGHLTTLLSRYYGRTFPLGGLGGVPFVGKTGYTAFASHVPANGHVLIVFGPHIGFSPTGEPGKFLRKGQVSTSAACGALNAAYNQVLSGKSFGADSSDWQQAWLRTKLKGAITEASVSAKPMVQLALGAYKVIEQEILDIVNTEYGLGKLVLLGGIQINMPYPMPGYFMPLHFSIRSRNMDPVDLMSTFD